MGRKCFFVARENFQSGRVALDRETSHHALNVLRVRAGDQVEIRDGRGSCWEAEVEQAAGGRLSARLVRPVIEKSESTLEITLAMAFVKADRMDVVVRQGTELGVSRFIALPTERSQYSLSPGSAEKRAERWNRIACEALCQCRRTILPEFHIHETLEALIAWSSEQAKGEGAGFLRTIALEKGSHPGMITIWERFPACTHLLVVVGPEGGWARDEGERLIDAGFHAIQLGPRVLRFETAAVALVSSAQLLWGDAR